jgi:HK97 gp10 family phage protein
MAKKNKAVNLDVSLVDNAKLVSEATDQQIEMALIAIGAKMESNAKALYVPVDTGRLKNSITYALAGGPAQISSYGADSGSGDDGEQGKYSGTAPSDPGGKVRSVYVGSNVEYAEIVEEGTSGRRGRHYLRDAVNNHIDEYKSLAERALSGKA